MAEGGWQHRLGLQAVCAPVRRPIRTAWWTHTSHCPGSHGVCGDCILSRHYYKGKSYSKGKSKSESKSSSKSKSKSKSSMKTKSKSKSKSKS